MNEWSLCVVDAGRMLEESSQENKGFQLDKAVAMLALLSMNLCMLLAFTMSNRVMTETNT